MKSNNFKIRITTLTPVCIGSGEELSPYSDYIIDKGYVYVVDKITLQDKIAQNDAWMETYIEGISCGMENNRSRFNLKDFIENTLRMDIENISIVKYELKTAGQQQKLPVKCMLKTPFGEAFIPGSSLKGAIKTAIMYDWINDINEQPKDGDPCIQWAKDLLRINPVRNDRKRTLEELLDSLNQDSIRKSEIEVFRITDSKPINKGRGIVIDCKRDVPLRIECISSGSEALCEIETNLDWHKLTRMINIYSYNMLCHNEHILQGDDRAYKEKLESLEGELDVLTDDLNSEIAYLRLGFGKGFYFNSIALALYDWVEEDEGKKEKLKKILSTEYRKLSNLDLFPTTYLKTDVTHEPLGWIKIERINYQE